MSFSRLAPDVLHSVAYYLGIAEPLGPPTSLAALLRIDKATHRHLNRHSNPHLWADLFRHSFDLAALRRRFPASSLTARHLAAEFERRWKSLKRVRNTAQTENWGKRAYKEALLTEDMLTVYLMLTESDGKNAVQLIQWANVPEWISSFTYKFIIEALSRNPKMPPEKPLWSLAMWITWMMTDYRCLLLENNSQHFKWISTAYMLGTFLYKNAFAPWVYPLLPLPSTLRQHYTAPARIISNFDPTDEDGEPFFRSRYIAADHSPLPLPVVVPGFQYLGQPLAISAPLVTHAATLIFFARLQATPMHMNQGNPNNPTDVFAHEEPPADFWLQQLNLRESTPNAKVSSGVSTLANPKLAGNLDRVFGARQYAPPFMHMRLPSLARSGSWDDDVLRMISCRDPFVGGRMFRELGAPCYRWKKGSLTGCWDGRFLLGNHETYMSVMDDQNALNALEETHYTQDIQSWSISEHYYVPPSSLPSYHRDSFAVANYPVLGCPIQPGAPPNGFVVPHYDLVRYPGEIIAKDGRHAASGAAVYRTWNWGMRGNDVDPPTAPAGMTSAIQDVDEEDLDDSPEDGYIKLIITGDAIARPSTVPILPTSMRIGSVLSGTVRLWDGLVILRATPDGLDEGHMASGHWTWRGYLQGDGNFVGRWREGTFDVRGNAYEGVFCMRRRVLEEEIAA